MKLQSATWGNPEPTEINGVGFVGDGMDNGNGYEVTLTLIVDAATPEEAADRAMQFRDRIGMGEPDEVRNLPFYWNLHHPYGC
jgi:hypothetical protein